MGAVLKERVFDKVKNSKPFMKRDIIIYIASFFLIASLFFAFVIFPNKTSSGGFVVSVDGNTFFTFDLNTKTEKIEENYSHLIEKTTEEYSVIFKVYTDEEKQGYNTILIDLENLCASVTESNCSIKKDCVHSPAVKDNGSIVCAPHKLRVAPINSNFDNPTVG